MTEEVAPATAGETGACSTPPATMRPDERSDENSLAIPVLSSASVRIADGDIEIDSREPGYGEPPPAGPCKVFVHVRAWTVDTGEKVEDTWEKHEPLQLMLGTHDDTDAVAVAAARAVTVRPELNGVRAVARSMREGERALARVSASWAYRDGHFSFPAVAAGAGVVYELRLLGWETAEEAYPRADMFFEERCRRAASLRATGNVLFAAGAWAAASSRYAMALSYVTEDLIMQLEGEHLAAAESLKLPCHANLAACALKLNDPRSALRETQAVLASRPNDPKALYRAGVARAALGQTTTAREMLESAARAAPGDAAIIAALRSIAADDRATAQATKAAWLGKLGGKGGATLAAGAAAAGLREVVAAPSLTIATRLRNWIGRMLGRAS